MRRRTSPRRTRRGLESVAGVSAPSDRRFRRRDVRPGRRRGLPLSLRRVIRVLASVGGVAVVAFWLARTLLGSELLEVDRIFVRGTVRLAASDVALLVDGVRGEHILKVDLDHYRNQVLGSPWVADVTLWRVLPSTIELRVTERQPMAVARLGSQLYLVDPAGVIIDEFGPRYRDVDLPIVDGLVSHQDGRPHVDPDGLRVAVHALTEIGRAPDLRDRLSQLDVANPHDVLALLSGDPVWLHLGDEAFAERLRRYLSMSEQFHELLPDLDEMDLRFDDRIPGTRGRESRWPRE